VTIPTQLRIACFTLAFASCIAMRAEASLQVELDLHDGDCELALTLADELGSQVDTTSSSSSSSSESEDLPEPREEIRSKLSHSNLPASATGSGNVVSDGGGADAPGVSSGTISTSGQTLTRRVYDRGQWIPDEPIFFLLKVPRLQTS